VTEKHGKERRKGACLFANGKEVPCSASKT
jgi:hypothetical protein